jgi:signal peptidase I
VILVLYLAIFYVLLSLSLYLLFPKADLAAVDGLIPGKNFIKWCEIIGRPAWWSLMLLIPILNIFIFCGMAVNLVRSFGRYGFGDSALAVICAPVIFYLISKKDSDKYLGPNVTMERDYMDEMKKAEKAGDKKKLERLISKNPYKKSFLREWTESIVFAVFAAAFIRMFLIEAFVIPTPSMEGSLLVGDFLFVSKASYGIRTPMTIAMVPLLHNRVPGLGTESYFRKPSLKYNRLPAFEEIDRNKPIVFNWPVGDSVYITSQRSYTVGQARRSDGAIPDRELWQKVKNEDYVVRPIDKKDHYIKRCIALPGDSIQIIDRQVYVNGKKAKNPEKIRFGYYINPPKSGISKQFLDKYDIAQNHADIRADSRGKAIYFLDSLQVAKLKELGDGVAVTPIVNTPQGEQLFPHDTKNYPGWTVDNYGPVWIPKKGATISLTPENISVYRRVIDVYEDNDLEIKGSKIIINQQEAGEYTFKQDYYWAMGDNRHNSEDSRAWGFVPHDHIVGKPLFIWFSTKNASLKDGIRFSRMFKSADID